MGARALALHMRAVEPARSGAMHGLAGGGFYVFVGIALMF